MALRCVAWQINGKYYRSHAVLDEAEMFNMFAYCAGEWVGRVKRLAATAQAAFANYPGVAGPQSFSWRTHDRCPWGGPGGKYCASMPLLNVVSVLVCFQAGGLAGTPMQLMPPRPAAAAPPPTHQLIPHPIVCVNTPPSRPPARARTGPLYLGFNATHEAVTAAFRDARSANSAAVSPEVAGWGVADWRASEALLHDGLCDGEIHKQQYYSFWHAIFGQLPCPTAAATPR